MKIIRPIFLMLLMALFLFSACSRGTGQTMRVQDAAPDFTLENLDGSEIVLSDVLKTKTVVLDFWAIWCPYCVKAIPHLEKFYAENKDKVALIAVDVGESKAKVENFVRKRRISYPVVLDPKGSVADLYKVRGIPTVVAVGQDGKIIYYGHSIKEMVRKIDF